MHTHRPSCLEGPVSGRRDWWRGARAASESDATARDTTEETPLQDDDPNFRADLVAKVRRQIADGTYDTPERWEEALDRLCDRLDGRDR
jgi:hypothetical protein